MSPEEIIPQEISKEEILRNPSSQEGEGWGEGEKKE
jgi:hypothetical protein